MQAGHRYLGQGRFRKALRAAEGPEAHRTPLPQPCSLTYETRAAAAVNPMARACLELMARKRTNLSVAADVATAEEMLEIADKVCVGDEGLWNTHSAYCSCMHAETSVCSPAQQDVTAPLTAPHGPCNLTRRSAPTFACSRRTLTSSTSEQGAGAACSHFGLLQQLVRGCCKNAAALCASRAGCSISSPLLS